MEDHKQYLKKKIRRRGKDLPDNETFTRAAKSILYMMTTLKEILINYFEINFSTSKADDF